MLVALQGRDDQVRPAADFWSDHSCCCSSRPLRSALNTNTNNTLALLPGWWQHGQHLSCSHSRLMAGLGLHMEKRCRVNVAARGPRSVTDRGIARDAIVCKLLIYDTCWRTQAVYIHGLQARVQIGGKISELVWINLVWFQNLRLVPYLNFHNRCFPLIVSSADRNICTALALSSTVISRATKNNQSNNSCWYCHIEEWKRDEISTSSCNYIGSTIIIISNTNQWKIVCVDCTPQSLFVMLLLSTSLCFSALIHGETEAMSFLGFDPLSLPTVTFLSTFPRGPSLSGNCFAYL